MTASDRPAHPPLGKELGELATLALPLIAGHAGQQLMGIVDTAVVGRLGKAALAGVGLGNALFFTVTLVGLGCVLGMDAPVSQAVGAGELGRARRVFWQGVRVALMVSVPAILIIAVLPLALDPVGVDPAAAAEARRYVWTRMPAVAPFLLFASCRSYLQAMGTTRSIVISTLIANVMNFVFNMLFVYGDATLVEIGLPAVGLPAFGVVGSAMATNVAQLTSLLIVASAVARVETPPDPARRRVEPGTIRAIFTLGVPIGLQLLAEMGVFGLASVMAGTLGAEAAAGHQVAITCASFTFMMAIGTGAATSVRVGRAVGRGDRPGARRAGLVGITVGGVVMAVPALVFLIIPGVIARSFTDDPAVIAVTMPLLMIAAVFQLSDGVQGVASGALRGAGDPRMPLYANLVGHYGVGLPISIALGLWAGWGAPGLWWGLSAGLTATAIGLTLRFNAVSKREIRRVG